MDGECTVIVILDIIRESVPFCIDDNQKYKTDIDNVPREYGSHSAITTTTLLLVPRFALNAKSTDDQKSQPKIQPCCLPSDR